MNNWIYSGIAYLQNYKNITNNLEYCFVRAPSITTMYNKWDARKDITGSMKIQNNPTVMNSSHEVCCKLDARQNSLDNEKLQEFDKLCVKLG